MFRRKPSARTYSLGAVGALALAALVWRVAAGTDRSEPDVLTHPVRRGLFTVVQSGRGVLEAKQAQVVQTPQLNWTMLKVAWLAPEGRYVKKGDLVAELEAAEIERAYVQARTDVAIARAERQRVEAQLNLERASLLAKLKETEAALQTARLQLSKMPFEAGRSRELIQLQIQRDEVEVEKLRKKVRANERIRQEEHARLQLQVQQAENRLKQAQHQLQQLTLRAPTDGLLQHARDWWGNKVTVGAQLWPFTPVVQIPDLSVMQVRLQLGETEAQKLRVGQRADITVPSLQDLRLPGKVTRVDKVAKPVRRQRKNTKVKRVAVVVEIDSTVAGLVPGLTADCRIVVAELADAVWLPRECVFETDSLKLVYVPEDDHFVPYAVAITRYGDDFVAVHSALQGHERCALTQPDPRRVVWPDTLFVPPRPATPDTTKLPRTADSTQASDPGAPNPVPQTTSKEK